MADYEEFNRNPFSGGRQAAVKPITTTTPTPMALPKFVDYNQAALQAARNPGALRATPGYTDFNALAQELGQGLAEQRQANLDAFSYMTPVSDAEYGIIRNRLVDVKSQGGDFQAEAYRMATAVEMSRFFGRSMESVMDNFEPSYKAWMGRDFAPTKTAFLAVMDSFKTGSLNIELGKTARAWMDSGGTDAAMEKKLDQISEQLVRYQDNTPRPWVIRALEAGAQSMPFTLRAAVAGIAGAGLAAAAIGTGGALAPAAIAALKAGASMLGSFAESSDTMRGFEYYEMRKAGISHEAAMPSANMSGALQGAIESLLGNVPGLAQLAGAPASIAGKVASTLAIRGGWGAVARAAMEYGGQALEEGLEEGIQQVISDTIQNSAKADFNLDVMSAGAIAKDAWEAAKGGFAASLVIGLPSSIVGGIKTGKAAAALKEYAVTTDRQTFIEQASKWAEIEGMPEEKRAAALSQIWEKSQAKAKDERQKGTTPEDEAKPFKRTDAGTLYTEETIVNSSKEGEIQAILKVGDSETKERLGHLLYTITDEGIVLVDSKFKKGYKGIRDEAIQELAAQYPNLQITASSSAPDSTRAAVERLEKANPHGTGANWYTEGGDQETTQARARLRLVIADKMPNVSPIQREAAILLHEFRANAQGVKFADYLKNEFSPEIIADKTGKVSVAQGQRAGILFTKGDQELHIGEFVKDAKALMMVTEKSDFVSFVHESGHLFRKQLIDTDLGKQLDEAYEIIGGTWTREHEERFTDDLMKYLSYGEAKDKRLRSVFQRIGEWIVRLWDSILNQADVDPRVRAVMDELFQSDKSPLGEASRTVGIANDGEQAAGATALEQGGKAAGSEEAGEVLFQPAPPENSEAFKKWFGDSKVVDAEGKPLVVYHGSPSKFEEFDLDKITNADYKGFFFSPNIEYAKMYRSNSFQEGTVAHKGIKEERDPNIVSAYLSILNPLDTRDKISNHPGLKEIDREQYKYSIESEESVAEFLQKSVGYRSSILEQSKFEKIRPLIDGTKQGSERHKAEYQKLIESLGFKSNDEYITERDTAKYQRQFMLKASFAITEEIKKLGYDGMLRTEYVTGYFMKPDISSPISYVVFSPAQIKSIDNRGTWDANDPRILFQSDDQWIYKAEEVASAKLQGPMPGKNILAMFRSAGVKEEELLWTGLADFLNTDEKIKPVELQEYLNQNKVKIEEVKKEINLYKQTAEEEALAQFEDEFNANDEGWAAFMDSSIVEESKNAWDDPKHLIWSSLRNDREKYIADEDGDEDDAFKNYNNDVSRLDFYEIFGNEEFEIIKNDAWAQNASDYIEAVNISRREESSYSANDDTTKFSQYALPGGENYTEILLMLPNEKTIPTYDEWVSVQNMKNPNANNLDFLGFQLPPEDKDTSLEFYAEYLKTATPFPKKEPYRSSHWDEVNVVAHARYNERTLADGRRMFFIEEIQSDWHQEGRKKGYSPENAKRLAEIQAEIQTIEAKGKEAPQEEKKRWAELMNEQAPLLENTGVPDAPFKKTWPEMTFRRMLRAAVKGGFDVMGWTTGEQQSARYDLSKQVDSVRIARRADDRFDICIKKDGSEVMSKDKITATELSDIIGKDLADRAITELKNPHNNKEYTGLDLKVGGEGMKGFYDKMLVDYANKYAKKWESKVEEAILETSTIVHSLPITPQMKESVSQGQVLFQLDEDAIDAEATTFDSWQEWKDYSETMAVGVFGEDTRAPDELDPKATDEWYKDRWDAVHAKKEEVSAEAHAAERREARKGQFAATMAKRGGVESLLSAIWDAEVQAFDMAQASDEAESVEIDKAYEWKKELAQRLAGHPLVLLSAQSMGNGKKLSPSTRKAILTYIRHNEVEFAALQAELTGDLDLAQYAEAGRAKLQSIPDPKLEGYANMSIAERTALLNRVSDTEVRERIKSGEYDDEYLADYVRRLEETKKTLEKETKDKAEEIKKLGGELEDESEFALKMYDRSKATKKDLESKEKELEKAKASRERVDAAKSAYVDALGSARDESKLSAKIAKKEYLAALNEARKEAAFQARFVAAEIRATTKLRAQRDSNRKAIMKKPAKNIIYAKRQEILTIQEYLRSKKWEYVEEQDDTGKKHRRRAYDTVVDKEGKKHKVPRYTTVQAENLKAALSMLLRESPGLAKLLTNETVDRINEKPVSAWTLAELQDLRAIIDRIAKEGREEYTIKKMMENRESASDRYDIDKTIRKNKNYKKPAAHGSEEERTQHKKMNASATWELPVTKMRYFAPIMDGGQEGINTKLLVHDEYAARRSEQAEKTRRLRKVHTRMRELNMTQKERQRKITIPGIGPEATDVTMSAARLSHVALLIKNQKGRAGYIFGNLFDEFERSHMGKEFLQVNGDAKYSKLVAAINSNLTVGEKEIIDMIAEGFAGAEFDRMNKMVIDLTNEEMKPEPFYSPLYREGAYFETQGDKIIDAMKAQHGLVVNPESGFTISRINIGNDHQTPVRVMDIVSMFEDAVSTQEHLIAYGAYIKKLHAVYQNQQLSKAVREDIIQTFGKDGMKYVDEYIGILANPGAGERSTPGDKALKKLRGYQAVGFLAFRFAPVVRQLITSPLPYMAYAPRQTLSAAFQAMKNPMKFIQEIEAKSEMLQSRTIDQLFETIKAMDKEGWEGIVRQIGATGMKGLEFADRISVTIGWKGVYDKELAAGATEAEAIKKADDITFQTQPSANPADLAPIYRNMSEWKKVLLMFTSSLNTVYNNIRHGVPKAIREKEYGQAVGIVTSYAIAGVLLGAFAKSLGKDPPPDDPDEWWRQWIFYSMTQFTDSVPVFGQELTSMTKRMVAGDKRMPFGEDTLPTVSAIISGFDSLSKGDIEKAAENFAEGVGLATGLPVLGIKDFAKGIGNIADGKENK